MPDSLSSVDLTEASWSGKPSAQIRTLFLLCGVPHPPIGGGALRNRQNIEALHRYGPVRLLSFVPSKACASNAVGAPPFVEFYTKPPRGAMRLLVWPFGRRVRRWWRDLSQRRRDDEIARGVWREIAVFDPDLIVFGQPFWVKYIPNLARLPARLIYDAQNVEAAMAGIIGSIPRDGSLRPAHKLKVLSETEARLAAAADQVWVCSEEDRALFGDIYGSEVATRVIPNGVDVDHYAGVAGRRARYVADPGQAAVPTLLFAGSFSYHPNVAAARLLVEDILPELRKSVPDARLVLCGNDPPNEMRRYAKNDPAIAVTGKVADTRPYFERCDLVVVPLLHGAGTRLKILEAFAIGCPVVSTTKGAEGLAVVDGEHLLIADTPEAMADQIARCLADRELASRLAEAGRTFVTEHYSWHANRRCIEDAVFALLELNQARMA